MTAVFLVPRRRDSGHRDRLWAYCKAKWERELPDIPIFEGHHEQGPFNRSAAINLAADLAGDWDVAVVIDSDVMVPAEQVRKAIAKARKTGKLVWAFDTRLGLSSEGTTQLLSGYDGDLERFVETRNDRSWSMCFAVPRKAWDRIGGFDERFVGWGWEDMAWRSAVLTLIQDDVREETHLPGNVIHLWHQRSDDRAQVRLPDGWIKITPEYLENTVLGRQYMDAAGDPLAIQRLLDAAAAERKRNARIRDRSVTLVIHTDGRRDYIEQTIPSLLANVSGPFVKKVIYDDSGDPAYKAWLDRTYTPFDIGTVGPAQRLGFGGSMEAMWRYLNRRCGSDFVFMVEDDFLFDRPVDLIPMIDVLRANEHLSQMALLRGPAYPKEFAAGGIIEQWPDKYTPVRQNGHAWIEHREYFTTNPCLFRRSLTKLAWPNVKSSERVYTRMLNESGANRFAYWGEGEPWVSHIGAVRAGGGY